jgi:hypothetical protein
MKPPERKLRVGLTDPEGPLARHLRDVFADSGLPVSRFVPLGTEPEAGALKPGEEEPEIVVAPARETVGDLDLLVLAGSPVDGEARRIAKENDVPVWDAAERPAASFGCAAILEPAAPESAVFTLILPAAEEGTAGIQELFRQTGDALNFHDTEAPTFGSRLAFNLFRDSRTDALAARIEARLAARYPSSPATVVAARAALFHGYAGTAVLRFADGDSAARAATRLRGAPGISSEKDRGASPAAAVESNGVLIDPPDVREDTLSVWFSFDGLALAAEDVLTLARRIGRE